MKKPDETKKCYIDYECDEYDRGTTLVCTYNHSENGICLFDCCERCRDLSNKCKCYE